MATIDPLQLILQDSKLEVLPRHRIFQIHYVSHLQMAGTENHNASLIQWKSIMIISVQKMKIIKLSQDPLLASLRIRLHNYHKNDHTYDQSWFSQTKIFFFIIFQNWQYDVPNDEFIFKNIDLIR